MWDVHREPLNKFIRHTISDSASTLTWSDVINLWSADPAFRDFYTGILASAPFAAFFWETPPVRSATLNNAFEFILADSRALDGVSADASAFANHFQSAPQGHEVVGFPNLSRDAWLIAPCPLPGHDCYAHLADFCRQGPAHQCREFWHKIGAAMQTQISDQPVWLSTSGLGVYWLHARLDTTPKYYTYEPYRRGAAARPL